MTYSNKLHFYFVTIFEGLLKSDSPGLTQWDGEGYTQEGVKGVALLKAMRACQGGPGETGKHTDHLIKAHDDLTM